MERLPAHSSNKAMLPPQSTCSQPSPTIHRRLSSTTTRTKHRWPFSKCRWSSLTVATATVLSPKNALSTSFPRILLCKALCIACSTLPVPSSTTWNARTLPHRPYRWYRPPIQQRLPRRPWRRPFRLLHRWSDTMSLSPTTYRSSFRSHVGILWSKNPGRYNTRVGCRSCCRAWRRGWPRLPPMQAPRTWQCLRRWHGHSS